MIAGYLHLGPAASGPVRFGRLSADFVEAHTSWEVLRVAASPDTLRPRWNRLAATARRLDDADVVHVQYAPRVWGGGLRQLGAVHAFTRRAGPPLVATAHDVLAGLPPTTGWTLRLLGRRAACLVVATRTERDRLRELGVAAPVEVVPHFVEERKGLAPLDEAKAALGLDGRRVVTLLGYVHRRKGHDIAVQALERLSADTVLVLAGGAVRDGPGFADRIRRDVRRRGLDDRVRMTGYLEEDLLDLHLSATDVGLLPFRDAAASGSLSTWLAAGRPLVGSDISVLREYRDLAPSLLRLVPPLDPAALARAVECTAPSPEITEEAGRLAARFSPGNTARRLADLYHRYGGTG